MIPIQDWTPIVERLKDKCRDFFGSQIFGEGTYTAILTREAPYYPPCVFVAAASMESSENESNWPIIRTNDDEFFDIIIVVRHYNDRRNQIKESELVEARNRVYEALQGWRPSDGYCEMTFDRTGEKTINDDGETWHTDTYRWKIVRRREMSCGL